MSWALALAVCALMVAVGFAAGWSMGRRAGVQRLVDAVLRRETRLRHPAIRGRERTGAQPIKFPSMTSAEVEVGVQRWRDGMAKFGYSVRDVERGDRT